MDVDMLSDNDLRQLARFPNFHHSSPLTYYPQRHIVMLYGGQSNIPMIPLFRKVLRSIEILNSNRSQPLRLTDNPFNLYYYVLSTCTSNNFDTRSSTGVGHFRTCMRLAARELKSDLQVLGYSHQALMGLETGFDISEQNIISVSNTMSSILALRTSMVSVRNHVQSLHVQSIDALTGPFRVLDMVLFCHKEIIIVMMSTNAEAALLINFDQWLMLIDTVSCRMLTRLVCSLNDISRVDNIPSYTLISKVYSWGDEIIRSCGMNAYMLLGEYESIVTGSFVTFEGSDPIGLGDDFIQSIMSSANGMYTEFGIPVHYTTQLLDLLHEVRSVNWLSELFGIRKHWGNPMVEAGPSGRTVQDRLNEELPISGISLVNLLASFNRMITLEFIRQHGKWPECEFTVGDEEYPLFRAWKQGVTRIPETSIGHHHLHWSMQRFMNNCVLDEYEDQLSLISDKSVSVYKEHMDAIYVQTLCHPDVRVRPEENRRLILEFIRREHMSIIDIFKIVMTGSVPDSWLANSSAMKGTEMKHEKARIFAVLTYELRQYFTATEDILKTNLFKYNPHQTMTMSESELLSKLRTVTSQMDPSSNSRFLFVMHIIDFSKWNLRMRYSNTCLVFKSIDNFIGMPGLIEQTHLLFSDMVNVVQDAFNPPMDGVLATNSDTIWRFHTAGWEGQRQKGWTLLTSALLSDIERITGVHSLICGQGDNQTLLSYFPVPEAYRNPNEWIHNDPNGIRVIVDRYYRRLESECLAVGLKVKTAESCRSLSYFNYGKRLYFNGVELSMTLKRISKAVTEPNGTYPITEMLLKTEEGAAFSAGLYSHPSLWPYFSSRVCLGLTVIDSLNKNPLCSNYGENYLVSQGLEINYRFLSVLFKIPPSLGGLPQLSLASYLLRGHPDPTCSDFVMLVLRSKSGCEVSKRIISAAYNGVWFKTETRDKSSLIASPFSFNLRIPQSARDPLEKNILPALKQSCRNPDISELFTYEFDNYEKLLMDALSSLSPLQPLVANDLYSRSLPGRRRSFLSGLTNTTSLGRLIYESHDNPIVNKVAEHERVQLKYWCDMVIYVASQPDFNETALNLSHHELVQHCRDLSWGTRVVGVTVPHPLEQFSLVLTNSDVCAEDCDRWCPEHVLFVRHSESIVELPGVDATHISTQRSRTGTPYLGNTMSEGLTQRYVTCLNPTASWRDSMRLNVIRKWVCSTGSNLDNLISDILRTRTNVPLSVLDLATGHPSRMSYSHRAALLATVKTCAISTTSNMQSRIYVSSNRMGEFSHGDFNYHMAFGPVFLCFQSLICMKAILNRGLTWNTIGREAYHAHVRRRDVPTVYDSNLSIDNLSSRLSAAQPCIYSRLLFSQESKLRFKSYSNPSQTDFWTPFSHASIQQAKIGYANQLLGESFASEIVIREQVTSDLLGCYSHRDNPIAVSDITLIGIENLVRALAANLILISPPSLFEPATSDRMIFSVVCGQFLDTFSFSFWSQFGTPLSVGRNVNMLATLLPSSSHFGLTRTSYSSTRLLRELVVRDIYLIRERLANALLITETASNLIDIYSPSPFALRLLWSKYVEICILTLAYLGKTDIGTARLFARDFSHNIHSLSLDNLQDVMIHVVLDFGRLISHLRVEGVGPLPEARCFSLIHPWVDKARSRGFSSNQRAVPLVNLQMFEIPDSGDNSTITFGPDEDYGEAQPCNCLDYTRPNSLHKECFFMTTGLLSKSHYKFLELAMRHDLKFENLICLGTSTGTEALGFSMFNHCSKIYVNCYFEISRFSQHSAGSYVPPAFVGQVTASKLVNPSQSVISSCDLLLDSTVNSVVLHTVDFTAPGVTCDVEMPGSTSIINYYQLCNNILHICTRRTVPAPWLIVKVPIRCRHEAYYIAGLLGKVFSEVSFEYSVYTRPGANLFFFVCKTPHSASFHTVSNILLTPLRYHNHTGFSRVMNRCIIRRDPGYCFLTRRFQISRKPLDLILRSSFPVACGTYVTGLGTCLISIPSRSQLKTSCLALISTLKQSAVEYIRIAFRTYRELTMVRSSILQVSTDPLHVTLNNIFLKVNRLEILVKLLAADTFDFSRCDSFCQDWLSRDHYYPIGQRHFKVEIDVTRFYNYYSRFLMEILGAVFKMQFTVGVRQQNLRLYHKNSQLGPIIRGVHTLLPCDLSQEFDQPDQRWLWEKRAEVFFYLFSMHVLRKRNIKLLTLHNYIIDDLIREYPNLSYTPCSTSTLETNTPEAIWMPGSVFPYSILDLIQTKATLCVHVRDLPVISGKIGVAGIYRLPWLGLVPSRVMLLVDRTLPVVSVTSFPRLRSYVNKYDESGVTLIGCGCIDCATEVQLLNEFNIQSGTIDMICSVTTIQSVRDKRHR